MPAASQLRTEHCHVAYALMVGQGGWRSSGDTTAKSKQRPSTSSTWVKDTATLGEGCIAGAGSAWVGVEAAEEAAERVLTGGSAAGRLAGSCGAVPPPAPPAPVLPSSAPLLALPQHMTVTCSLDDLRASALQGC